jgi:hypothetical protein
MKSAYELAMERMEKANGPSRKLDDGQKAAIADIETKCQAKIAELKLSFDARLAAVTTYEEHEAVQQEMRQRIAEVEERMEHDKNAVWDQAG